MLTINLKSLLKIVLILVIVALSCLIIGFFVSDYSANNKEHFYNKNIIPIAVLGDSDSHSYRDEYDNKFRGGAFHSVTYNWPALWNKFRSHTITMGAFDTWGTHYRIAKIKHHLGLVGRAPKKLDYEYNYAVSGLRCESLLQGWPYQAKWLITRLKNNPEAWKNGIVVIRIGVNNLGSTKQLIQWGNTGLDDHANKVIDACISQIIEASDQILKTHPSIKIALLGMCRDCNITDTYTVWPTLTQITKRNTVLNHFDQKLMAYTQEKDRVLFIDDVKWLIKRYGDRHNEPIKFATTLADKVSIVSAQGDHPSNLILADYHAGTVYNGLWLNNLIAQLNQGFQLDLTPLSEDEIYSVIAPAL